MSKRKYFGVVFIILATASLIPFPTTLVPEWKLKVVDEKGNPYVGKGVRQFCDHYSLGFKEYRVAESDADGYVTFPEVTIWMSAAMRVFRTTTAYMLLIAHGSVGPSVSVDSSGPDGYKRLDYGGSGEPPTEIVLPSKHATTQN